MANSAGPLSIDEIEKAIWAGATDGDDIPDHWPQWLIGAALAVIDALHGVEVVPAAALSRAEQERDEARGALAFYADPDTYFAIGFVCDPPCGGFAEDVDKTGKPGARARAALAGGTGER